MLDTIKSLVANFVSIPKNVATGLFYQNERPSVPLIVSVTFALVFIIVSCYLVFHGLTWVHYDTFAYITGTGGISGVGTHVINSVWNSPKGESPK